MMMKKLLVLMLVFGVSSLASAGLILTANGADVDVVDAQSVAVTVESTAGITGFWITIGVEGGTLSGVPNYPETWMFAPFTVAQDNVSVEVTGGDFFPKAGPLRVLDGITVTRTADQAVVTLVAAGPTNIAEGVFDAGEVFDSFTIVPEPMSMVLLGLGGLFLRRRK